MSVTGFFDIELKSPICIDGIGEDSLRALVDAIKIKVKDKNFGGFVMSSNGVKVKFLFGADGSFQGVYATLNGQQVLLIPGTDSKGLSIFKGPPSSTNPGPGWQTEPALTRTYLNQPGDENAWEIFYASRVSVLNR